MRKKTNTEDIEANCPKRKIHTKQPEGYVQWMEWAERKHRLGYVQENCPGCGLYAIWRKKTAIHR